MRLTHVRMLVSDMSAAFRFYRDVLELPTTWDENPGYAEFQLGPDTALAIFPREEMAEVVELRPPGGESAVAVLSVEDVTATVARLRGRGATVSDAQDRPDWGIRVAYVRDPEGNLFELYEDIEWVRE
jgi:catechol 2,3-dioxygenase-like lactoylglutathione lyase family enzyme